MMRTLLFILFSMANVAYALDAVVTVLESPMLKEKDLDSQVVQYLRKGDVIKIDPAEKNKSDGGPFIKVIDRSGHEAYIVRDHVFIYFEDKREFTQTPLPVDPTDYRLEEPLPKKYPLFSPTGYRGQIIVGATQPYPQSYPYDSNIKTKGYMNPIDVSVTALRQAPDDQHDRFYLGGTLNVRTFTNRYALTNGRNTTEQNVKLGIGPTISYDAFKGEKNRVNLSGTICLYLWNQMNITQTQPGVSSDNRTYRAMSFSPRLNIQYHRKQILPDMDFVLGTFMEVEPRTEFHATTAPKNVSWWRGRVHDRFRMSSVFSLGGYLGLQTAY